MPETNEIEYLYHYTSIEKLALILKNRTIRLNPLDKMDDLQEQKTADVKNLGRFVFVSSWTTDTKESIPMWKMYTDPSSGVRIRLRKNPFVRHRTSKEDVAEVTRRGLEIQTDSDGTADTFINILESVKKSFYCIQTYHKSILEPVIYTNDPNLLEPQVYHDDGVHIHLDLGKLGIHKSEYWEFQHEWRYRLSFIRMQYISNAELAEKVATDTMRRMIKGIETPPIDYYDLDIAEDCFSQMEITCSPQMTLGNRILLESLVEKYNPSAQIIDSELLGKL